MVCHDYTMLLAKEKMKDKKKASQEKSDDTLAKIQVPAGEDNASDTLNTVARQLRPVNKEMADQMSWQARERKEIVRNLPLEVYGLVDLVATKPIELCHNLASNITIDMFCPGGKKATNTKQKACMTKDGELAVETSEIYGDLESVQDVVLAWNTLSAIWQKNFPVWPAANIGLRVIFKMRMFQHCGYEAKEVMIAFSNRLLTSNSQRAASKKGPLSFERAFSLAGSVCMDHGYDKELPATKGNAFVNVKTGFQGGRGGHNAGGRGGQQHSRGGRGLPGQQSRGVLGGLQGSHQGGQGGHLTQGLVVKIGNDTLCHFYQSGTCHNQNQKNCARRDGMHRHACAFIKTGGSVCGGAHTKAEHDVTKHCG